MMTVTVNITGLEPIADAIDRLARALGTSGVTTNIQTREAVGAPLPSAPGQSPNGNPAPETFGGFPGPAPTSQSQQPGVPVGNPNYAAPPFGNTAGPASLPGQIPTTATPQEYTQDQIAVAMTGLVDQGKQPQVMQILAQFGAASLMQVPKEQYAALATLLRQLGANI